MSEHTKEPWEVVTPNNASQGFGIKKEDKYIVWCGSGHGAGCLFGEADALRIVACVNAFAGISNEALQEPMFRDAMKVKGSYIDLMSENESLKTKATEADALIAKLREELAEAKKDAERLNFIDSMNERKNKQCGTTYGWKLEENHNRIALSDHNFPHKTVREAIDEFLKG